VEYTGELTSAATTLRVWSCTFASAGHVYTIGYTLSLTDADQEARLRAMAGRVSLKGPVPCAQNGPCQDILAR